MSDLRFAARQLVKTPGFTAIVVLTLALGIGSCTAMFSVLRAIVLQPFSYPQSEQIAHVWSNEKGRPLSLPDFVDLAESTTAFAEFGAYSPQPANLGGANPQAVTSVSCTAGVLRAFGVPPALGRWLEPADSAVGAPPVAVISHALWQQSFGGDPTVLGRSVRINGGAVTVVGIMPADFEFVSPWLITETCQLWLPLTYTRGEGNRDMRWLSAVGRLKSGVTLASADAELKSIGLRLTAAYPHSNARVTFFARSLHREMTHLAGTPVWMLCGAVGLVLLIACANVSSMLLARGARRQSELGVRIALGATRGQIIRLGLAESVLLAGVAAMLGAILAWWGVDALAALLPVSDGRRAAITLDASVLAFALATACFCALVAGLPSAVAALRGSVTELLRSGGRTSVGSQTRHHTLRALVVAQVAIAFVLADGATRLSSGYVKLLAANQSLASEHVLSAALNLQGRRYAEKSARVALWERAAEQVAGLPGVAAVGLISKLPLDGQADLSVLINDEVYEVAAQRTITEVSSITPGYFAAAGIPLLRGRTLEPADAHEGSLGVVVNRAFADACWPNQDPMGKVVRSNTANPWFTARVVGVVENIRQWGADTEPRPEIYWSPQQAWGQTAYLIVRSPLPAAQLAPLLRAEVARIDRDLPLSQVRTLQNVVHDATKGQRMLAGLINFFMGTALGLIAVGLYGTLSYNVLQRTREIGVRMAMGARRRSIVALVFRQGLHWVLAGLGLGLIASLALTFALRSLVFGLDALDPVAFAIAVAVVVITTGFACCIPAWRSGKMNPLEALRAE